MEKSDETRKQAEQQLESKAELLPESVSVEELQRLIHELQVHLFELEMQNDELRKTRDRLEASNTKYSDLFDFAPVGYLTLNENGLILEANLTVANQLRTERSRLVKSQFAKYMGMEEADKLRLHLEKVFKTRERQSCDVCLITTSGSHFHAHLNSIFAEDSSGNTLCKMAVTDITERNRNEEALKESKERFRTLENATWEGIIIHKEGIIIEANQSASKLVQYPVEDIIGKSIIDFLAPESIEPAMQKFREGLTGDQLYLELKILRKDKTVISVEALGRPIRYNDVHARVIAFRDITERKRNEEALKESEEKFRLLVENSHDIIYKMTADGMFSYVSPNWTRFLGHTIDMVDGYSFRLFVHPDNIAECEKWLQKVIATGQQQEGIEYRVQHLDGSWKWHTSSAVPIKNEFGNTIGYYGIARDITERKHAQEALKESEERYREIFDSSNDALFVQDIPSGSILDVNKKMLEMFGYDDKREALKCTIEDLSAVEEGYNEEKIKEMNKKAIDSNLNSFKWRSKKKDGEKFWSQVLLQNTQIGGANRILSSVQDITERKLAEEKLLQEKQFSELLLNSLPGIFYLYNYPELRLIRWNKLHETLLGYTAEETSGKSVTDWIPPESHEATIKAIELVMEKGNNSLEAALLAKDGHLVPFCFTGVRFETQGRLFFMGIGIDITERKHAEEALKQSERFLHNIVENIPDMVFVKDAKKLRFVKFNKAGEDLLGYSREELIGKNDYDFFPKSEADFFTEIDRKAMKNKSLMSISEEMIQTKNKGNRILHTKKIPIYDAQGNPEYLLGISEDITERKHTENALKESEARYRTVARMSSDFAYSYIHAGDAGYEVDWITDAFFSLTGYSEAELHEQRCWLFVTHPDDREMATKAIYELKAGESDTREFRIIIKGGQIRYLINHMECRRSPEAPGCSRIFGAARDITERTQAEVERRTLEERLHRAEKMEALGTLAGGVAHDLNNVLGIVVGYSELVSDELDDSSSVKSYVREIQKGGERAAAIVQDLLTLTRRGVPGRKILNLNVIVRDCQKSPEFTALSSNHPNIRIKSDFEEDILNISGSSVHLGKSFLNLVSNAAEAMQNGGTVTIKTRNQYLDKPISGYDEVKEGDYVVLSISDTGEGISASDLKRIFEPFYTKKIMGRSGTGLGLAVVWGTVKDHYGYINVESEEEKGTTFTLYFPVTREELTPEHVAVSASAYKGKGESILVVDDVKEQRELATTMLTKLNYKVMNVPSGEDAVEYLKQHTVDLVLFDMIMEPGMDGLDTYVKILEIHPHQKAIIVSGFSETERVTKAQSLGAGAYVKKPYVLEKLGLAIKKELDRPS